MQKIQLNCKEEVAHTIFQHAVSVLVFVLIKLLDI
jgi:hypothetical protein